MEDCDISDSLTDELVSIIIPTHNRAHLICETIDSVFSQLYTKIELIIVDDHSTDNTEEIIKYKMDNSPLYSFRYLKSERRGGCAARNLGLSVSSGEYIQFFDDDDIMMPNHIVDKVSILRSCSHYDFVTCNFLYFRGNVDNVVEEKRIDNIVHSIESHLLKSAFPAPAFMCRRSCIQKIGFWNENIFKFQDICYFHRLFLYSQSGFFMKENLFYVRLHYNNITSNKSRLLYQSMIDSFEAVSAEWRLNGKTTDKLLDIIYILKVIILTQAYKHGYYYWCLSVFFSLSLNNFKQLMHFLCIVSFKFLKTIRNGRVTIYDILILSQ